jgi:hypothetical protein
LPSKEYLPSTRYVPFDAATNATSGAKLDRARGGDPQPASGTHVGVGVDDGHDQLPEAVDGHRDRGLKGADVDVVLDVLQVPLYDLLAQSGDVGHCHHDTDSSFSIRGYFSIPFTFSPSSQNLCIQLKDTLTL